MDLQHFLFPTEDGADSPAAEGHRQYEDPNALPSRVSFLTQGSGSSFSQTVSGCSDDVNDQEFGTIVPEDWVVTRNTVDMSATSPTPPTQQYGQPYEGVDVISMAQQSIGEHPNTEQWMMNDTSPSPEIEIQSFESLRYGELVFKVDGSEVGTDPGPFLQPQSRPQSFLVPDAATMTNKWAPQDDTSSSIQREDTEAVGLSAALYRINQSGQNAPSITDDIGPWNTWSLREPQMASNSHTADIASGPRSDSFLNMRGEDVENCGFRVDHPQMDQRGHAVSPMFHGTYLRGQHFHQDRTRPAGIWYSSPNSGYSAGAASGDHRTGSNAEDITTPSTSIDRSTDDMYPSMATLQPYSSEDRGSASGLSPCPSLTPSSVPSTVGCEVENCGAIFSGTYRNGNLARHIRLKHGRIVTKYPCGVAGCRKSYMRQDARLKHYRNAHPELAKAGAIPRTGRLLSG